MTPTLETQTRPQSQTLWGCLTSEGIFQCQQTDAGWQACSVKGNVTAVYGECFPHSAAAMATLWQVILSSEQTLIRVNPTHLPDDPTQLKQIIARLVNTGTLTLECFSAYHKQSFAIQDIRTAFTQLHQPQDLFQGAVNGPTFSYQRLVDGSGTVISEVGDPAIEEQFRQFTEACTRFQPALAHPL